jgi:hypothetical protein
MVAIIESQDEGEQVAMRIVDALVLMGCMTEDQGLATVQQVGDIQLSDFRRMLEQSRWVLDKEAA